MKSDAGIPDISVVTVNWKVKDLLDACIRSVFARTRRHGVEMIVVDNDSRDGSVEMVRDKYPAVNLIANPENSGIAKGNNLGAAASRGRYIVFLNPDTEIIDSALDDMADWLDAHPEAGAVTCKLLSADDSAQRSCCSAFPSLWTEFCDLSTLSVRFPRSRLFNGVMMVDWDYNGTREVERAATACMMVRREAVEEIGGMDERFFFMYDDVDFCRRLRLRGRRIFYVGDIRIRHYHRASSSQAAKFARAITHRGSKLYFRKHTSFPVAIIHSIMTSFFHHFWASILKLTGRA